MKYIEACAVSVFVDIRQLLPKCAGLVEPGYHTVGERAFAGKGGYAVEPVVLFFPYGYELAEIVVQFHILVLPGGRRLDSGCIYVAVDDLRALFREIVVKEEGFGAVSGDELEIEIEVIVEAVGRDRVVTPLAVILIHLECGGEELGPAYHWNGDVADKYGAFERAFGVP